MAWPDPVSPQTAAWAGSILIPYDDLPNHGVVALPSRLYTGDLDGDGDVDGADLAAFIANPAGIAPADFAANFGMVSGVGPMSLADYSLFIFQEKVFSGPISSFLISKRSP